jgi:hypothetical protein
MSSDYEAIRANMQKALADFLWAELDSGKTVVNAALLVKEAGSTDYFVQAKRHSAQALENVKKFVGQLKDTGTRVAMQDQVAELERMISTLHNRIP